MSDLHDITTVIYIFAQCISPTGCLKYVARLTPDFGKILAMSTRPKNQQHRAYFAPLRSVLVVLSCKDNVNESKLRPIFTKISKKL